LIGDVPKQMYNLRMQYGQLLLFLIILSACTLPANTTTSNDQQIEQAVAATLAAIPRNTEQPIPTPYPSPTPFDLKGLFCEYQFCIGHPVDMSFFDVNAQNNKASPSTYSQGIVASFNATLFIQMIWQLSPGSADPQFMLDLILDDVDTRVGNLDVKLIRDMNVIYVPITTTATPVLPYGAAGAWICGERAFGWKIYSAQADNTQALFDQAIDRFRCTP